jgi:hypothetical protein
LHFLQTSLCRRLGDCRQEDGAMNCLRHPLGRLKSPMTVEKNAGNNVCQVAPNICTSSVWNLLYINLLASRVLAASQPLENCRPQSCDKT